MTLLEFKNHISAAKKGKLFNFGISTPFSWRGVYAEVAFCISESPSTREEILANIEKAYNSVFWGYKGGEYEYDDDTEVHFEEGKSRYTDGKYCAEMIAKIEVSEVYESQEMRLVKIAFPK